MLNGTTVIASTRDPSLLNGGTLAPGQSVGLVVTLKVPITNSGLEAVYSLTDPATRTSFTVTYTYNLTYGQ